MKALVKSLHDLIHFYFSKLISMGSRGNFEMTITNLWLVISITSIFQKKSQISIDYKKSCIWPIFQAIFLNKSINNNFSLKNMCIWLKSNQCNGCKQFSKIILNERMFLSWQLNIWAPFGLALSISCHMDVWVRAAKNVSTTQETSNSVQY